MDEPLLSTKLYIPPPRPGSTPRPRLIDRLNAALERKLVLLSAAPGAGKTVLLGQWIYTGREKDEAAFLRQRVAWVSLDEGDNDPVRFMTYLVSALQTIDAGLGAGVLTLLRSPQPPPMEAVLAAIVNDAAPLSEPVVVVLDDYHAITAEAVHRGVTFLLDRAPPQLHLVIGTRADPPLPLARLRGRGELAEIRTADLGFTAAEAAELFNTNLGLDLPAEDVEVLEKRTEGWAAGLQMAGLSLQAQPAAGRHRFVAAFAGDDRHVVDYLMEEVLRGQPGPVQEFLFQTSILDRLCGPLCDAITARGPTSGQETLEALERANLFVMPLDGRREWYRYHHLFADLLRQRLERTQPGQVSTLHRRAAEWYEQNGLPAEAVRHAWAAHDFDRMARLVEAVGQTFTWRGEMATLAGWLEALPEKLICSRPRLGLIHAWLLLALMQLDRLEHRLRDVEQRLPEDAADGVEARRIAGEVATLRATASGMRGDMAAAIELGGQALALLPAGDVRMRAMLANTLGTAHEASGNAEQARAAYAEAAELSQAAGNILIALIALGNLARLLQGLGQLRQSTDVCHRALRLAAERDAEMVPSLGMAHLGLAAVHYARNELDAAAQRLAAGIELGRRAGIAELVAAGHVIQVRLRTAVGDLSGAWDAVHRAEGLVAAGQVSRGVAVAVSDARARLLAQACSRGEAEGVERARAWVDSAPLSPADESNPLRRDEYVTLARLLVHLGRGAEADPRLERLLAAADRQGRRGDAIELLVLRSLALDGLGDAARATATLESALSLAEPEGYVRPFVDEGERVRALLVAIRANPSFRPAADRLLSAFSSAESPIQSRKSQIQNPDALSDRELDILRLLAAGLSNREIADRLVMTVGTAKWHVNNIYGKLGVHSRTQALARARDLGLI